MAKQSEIELVNFFIFNPSLGTKEEEEHKKLIYFHPSSHSNDSKMKVVGLSEAIINFMGIFSESACDSMNTQKTKQFYFNPEPDYWMVLTVSVPKRERVIEEEKGGGGGGGRVVVEEYLDELVIEDTYQAVLRRIYFMFKMFNGSIESILSEHSIEALKLRVEHFCSKYLPTIHFNHCDILDVFGGLFYLPLDQNSYLKVQGFVHAFECIFSTVHSTMLLYNSQLIWSGLDQQDSKLMFHFMLSSVYPAILQKDFTPSHSSTPSPHPTTHPYTQDSSSTPSISPSPIHPPLSASTSRPPFHQTHPSCSNPLPSPHLNPCDCIKIGGYTLGPPDLSNPSNLGQIPLVHLPTFPSTHSSNDLLPPINPSSHSSTTPPITPSTEASSHPSIDPSSHPSNTPTVCRLLVYKLYDALICILVEGSEDPPFEMMVMMDAYLSYHLPPLVSCLASTVKKSTPEHTYKYVYYNQVNGAQKTTIHNTHHTTLTTSPHFLNTLSSIHQDLTGNSEREEEGCETMVKIGGKGWVVGRRGEGRQLYVVMEQKGAGLVAINDDVKKICSSHFPNLFFTD